MVHNSTQVSGRGAWFVFAAMAAGLSGADPPPKPLSSAAAVRNLSPAVAATGVPVHLTGVVTGLSGWKNSFFFQDSSGGISIDRRDDSPVLQGDAVEVEGVSGPGLFAPVVLSDRVKVTGKGRLPAAREYLWSELALGKSDSRRIAVRGVVHSATLGENWGRQTLFLDIETPGGPIQGLVHDFPAGDSFTGLVDSLILVQGVCGTIFNDRRQFLGLRLFVQNLSDLHVESSPPADQFDAAISPLYTLLQFGFDGKAGRRIAVKGTVTFSSADQTVYLQDGNYGIRVKTAKPSNLRIGASAIASGFLEAHEYSPGLENAMIREATAGPPLQAARVSPSDLIQSKDGFTFAPYSNQLVEVETTVTDSFDHGRQKTLVLRNGETSFQAGYRSQAAFKAAEQEVPPVGSMVRLTGICVVESGKDRIPKAFSLLLRSAGDVKLLKTPFWTVVKASWSAVALLALIGGMLIRSRILRAAVIFRGALDRPGIETHPNVKVVVWWRVLALTGAAMGLAELTGWMTGITRLAVPIPGFAPMVPNAAICAILLGAAISIKRPAGKSPATVLPGLLAAIASCLAASCIAAANLIEQFGGVNLRIDRWIVPHPPLAAILLGPTPGRMAISSSLCVLFIGLAVLLRLSRRFAGLAQGLLFLVLADCLLQWMRLLYGWHTFGIFSVTVMTLPAVGTFTLLCLAELCARPDEAAMRILLSRGPEGILARRLLPAAIAVPAALGWLRWQGELSGLYSTPFGLIIHTSSQIVIFIVLIFLASNLIGRTDKVRSAAERNLRNSEERLGELADAMPQIVWTTSPSGKKDYFNRRWFEYTGQAMGAPPENALASVAHPEDLERLKYQWEVALANGRPFSAEIRLKGVSGEYRWHLKRLVPVRAEGGEVIRWIGTCTDVEDYKKVQKALLELNQDLEARVEERTRQIAAATAELEQTYAQLKAIMGATTQVCIIFTDPERVIQMFNKGAEKMLGYSAPEVVGIATTDILLDPLQVEARLASLSRERGVPMVRRDLFIAPALEGIAEFQEWDYVRKDGGFMPVSLEVTAVRDAASNVIGFLGIGTDVSRSRAMELALRHNNQELAAQTRRAETANRAKDRFLATISHEIRTPMNAIMGISEILSETLLDGEQRNYVEITRRAGSALMSLINDMLDISKIEAGHLELEKIDFDLEEVLDQCLELMAPRARAKRLVLALKSEHSLPAVLTGDAARLRQILLNLLGNAVKFTPRGEIVLSVVNTGEPGSGGIGFAVSDTGIGIAANKLSAIFEDFSQADSSTTRNYGGTGLGLGISRRLVELMGGRLTVESTLGRGSTFHFEVEFEIPANPRKTAPPADELRGTSALVLDDNLTNRAILMDLLNSWGIDCADFARPGEALAGLQARVAAGRDFDAILVDCHMDETNGFEVAKCMRYLAPRTPVVMLTSDVQAADTARQVEAGLAGLAVKPVRKSHLFRLIRDAMGKAAGTAGAERALAAAQPGPRPLRILAAEDVPDNQLLLRAFLKGSPHLITFAEDGAEAVAAFREGGFDVVLMDMLMPVMDGLEATRAIRQFEQSSGLPATPVIAFSANASATDIKRSLEAGCQTHLSKPISKSRLLAVLEEYAATPGLAGQFQPA